MGEMDSISGIISVEEKNKSLMAKLNKEKEVALYRARIDAEKMVQDATEKANKIKVDAISKATHDAEKLHNSMIQSAELKAKKIVVMKLSKEKEKQIINEFINILL
ncbi:MAG: hypothetical protein ACP5M9_02970 [Candidatus Micrarchaeia archaeon]